MWQCHCRKFKKKKKNGNYGNGIAENVKKKIKNNCFGNCGNVIAENVKKKKKKIVLAIAAIPLPKMEKRNYKICE